MQKKKRGKKTILYLVIIIGLAALELLIGKNYFWDQNQTVSTFHSSPVQITEQTAPKAQAQAIPDKNDPLLILVNASNPIPKDWKTDLVQLKDGQSIDRRAYGSLQKMLDDARAQGLDPLICSGYRTKELQTKLFNDQVNTYQNQGLSKEDAKKKAAVWIAVPGTSEHQTGLAVDIYSVGNQRLDRSQEKTAVQKWLIKNCWKYGYILRYPSDKRKITGIGYEPWHYRYVGKRAAKAIYKQHVCLEEYLRH